MNTGASWPTFDEAEPRVHSIQTKLHQWVKSNGMNPWRAGCGESRTSGSEGGPEKPTGGNAGTALRSDPYERHEALCLLWDDVSRFGCSSKYRR